MADATEKECDIKKHKHPTSGAHQKSLDYKDDLILNFPCLNKFVAGELAITNKCANETERKGRTERLNALVYLQRTSTYCATYCAKLFCKVGSCIWKFLFLPAFCTSIFITYVFRQKL